MRKAARTDRNQAEIVAALRKVGASVQSLAAVGNGVPDLLVGFRRATYLLEVKDGNQPPSARELTVDQIAWHLEWCGGVCVVVNSVDDALAAIGVFNAELTAPMTAAQEHEDETRLTPVRPV